MATRGAQAIELGPWLGLWARSEVPPNDHFSELTDGMFQHQVVYPRPLFTQVRTLGIQPLRSVPFKLSANPIGSRWLVLGANLSAGNTREVYDVTVGGPSTQLVAGLSTTILDMTVVVVYDRAYISFHDRVRADTVTPVYVWDPSTMSSARPAAGLAPTGTFTVAVSATNGNVEPGLHILAVAFETNTGHITVPGLYGSIVAPGGTKKKLDLTAIPLGPTGTIARQILMTKVVNNFDGNFQAPAIYLALRVADNTTTALTGASGLDKYDTDLIKSGDYLKDQYESLPSGVAMTIYASRLCIGNVNIPYASVPGLPPLPPKAERSLIIASNTTCLESISKVDGFKQITKSEGGGIKQMSEVNGILYARKSFMTFALQDNGQEIGKWPVNCIDVATGTECYGVATFPGTSAGSTKGVQIIADRAGLYVFDGAYQPRALTWKVENIWRSIDHARFAEIMVTVDPERNWLAVLLPPHTSPIPLEGAYTGFDRILFADFNLGLDPDNIRWSYWTRIINSASKPCVGLNFDYRESLAPSLTAVMQDVTNSGEIQALPNDLETNPVRVAMQLTYVVHMHPEGGLGTAVAVRHRFARIKNPAGSFDIRFMNAPHSDPNGVTRPVVGSLTTAPLGFDRFANYLTKVGRAHLETLYVSMGGPGTGFNAYALSKVWVFLQSSDAERLA